ncbi:hypothetical protein LSTR_LSTR014084 [Laodelphax striatellus]|uniref:Uncharacterized protein n=1 Tax=Laodelphax striatellus TaxID=195883 RepID=A0A482XHA5_LAOST|nr:hypothetical protein LSTR_LSTR014084 [Laodelphax striatellus]
MWRLQRSRLRSSISWLDTSSYVWNQNTCIGSVAGSPKQSKGVQSRLDRITPNGEWSTFFFDQLTMHSMATAQFRISTLASNSLSRLIFS